MVSFLRACGVRDDQVTLWSRAWERIAEQAQGIEPSDSLARRGRVAASSVRYSGRPRRDPASNAQAESVRARRSAEFRPDTVSPQLALLREQINRLDADNERLRLQLAALGRPRAGREPQGADLADPRAAHSPIARRRELGALLRTLRLEKGLEVKQVADYLMCSVNKVRRMEASFRAGTPRDVRDLCALYGVTDEAERDRMMNLAVEGKQPAWWQSYDLDYETYVGLEAEAVNISAFQSSVVHGLLQTAEYARAGHEAAMPRFSPERIEMQIEAKLTRQRILARENPPRLAVVLDEAALRRMVGGRRVMAAQLTKILDMSTLPNVIVQVLPYERGAHPALESNFTILELPSPTPGIVFVEGLIGSVYLEDADDIKRYLEILKRLQSIALNPEDTVSLIAGLNRSYAAMP